MTQAGTLVRGRWMKLLATLLGLTGVVVGTGGCGAPVPKYGIVGDFCGTDTDCQQRHGSGWVCGSSEECEPQPDAGAPDAGRAR